MSEVTKPNSYGFSGEEQAAFDAMKSGQPVEVKDAPPPADAKPDPVRADAPPAAGDKAEAKPDAGAKPADAKAAGEGEKAPDPKAGEADDDADDDGDEPTQAAEGDAQPVHKRVNGRKFERMRARAIKAETALAEREKSLADERTQNARLDERLKLINEALASGGQKPQQEEPSDPEPDPEKDIFAHNKWLTRQVVSANEKLQKMQQGNAASDQRSHMLGAYRSDAVRFSQENNDFGAAYTHLIEGRLKELEAAGIVDPNQRARMVQDEESALVERAFSNRQSPAQVIYNMAKVRGYAPAPANGASNGNGAAPANGTAAPGQAAPAANGNGAGAPLAPAASAAPSVAAEIEALKNAKAGSTSLSQGGGAPGDQLTPQVLANMSQDEFSALLPRLSKSRQRELLGG